MRIGLLDSGVGVIPFVKEIIIQNKRNQYYIKMDYGFFPYGNKSREVLEKRLLFLLNYFSTLKIDKLIICCNTLSYIYLTSKINTPYQVKTILETNLSKGYPLLATTYLAINLSCLDGKTLASLIENNQIKEIIQFIKKQKQDNFTLSCTHYPLVKSIFTYYGFHVFSYEKEVIESLPIEQELTFFADEYTQNKIKHYFPDLSIKLLFK